jgi:histone H3/H4
MAKAKGKPSKAANKEVLLIASKVRAAVNWLVQEATARAKANGRKTVRAHDFVVSM